MRVGSRRGRTDCRTARRGSGTPDRRTSLSVTRRDENGQESQHRCQPSVIPASSWTDGSMAYLGGGTVAATRAGGWTGWTGWPFF